MSKPKKFIVKEMISCDGLMLKDVIRLDNSSFCSVDKNEMLFSKNCIKLNNVEEVVIDKGVNNLHIFMVSVKENKERNENTKKRHPIRWALGLISKSKPIVFTVGVTDDNESIKKLVEFFLAKA